MKDGNRTEDREAAPREGFSGEDLRRLLEPAVALATDYWDRLPGARAYTRPTEAARERVRDEELPETAVPPESTFSTIAETVMRAPLGCGHPRWWAFISASAHPMGVAADLITGAMNHACFTGAQIATDYEHVVLRWLGTICGVPHLGSGILVSGGSMANMVALATARDAMAEPGHARRQGPVAVYFSSQAHFSIPRALRLLGFDPLELRPIPTDSGMRLDVASLRAALRRDRGLGIRPIAIVATAGTAGTGTIDPLADLAAIARDEECWFHVDAAYGGPAASLPELQDRFAGMDGCDSLTVDPHKWLYVPYEAGAVLVRRSEDLSRAFRSGAPYTDWSRETYFGDSVQFQDLGPQQTRTFRALKVWATMRSIGMDGYRALWREDIAIAREVCRLARENPPLEVLSEGDLSIFVLRYVPRRGDANAFNQRLLDAVHRDGRVFLGPMTVDGKFGLRGCVVNFRSRPEDAVVCVRTILEIGKGLESGGHPEALR